MSTGSSETVFEAAPGAFLKLAGKIEIEGLDGTGAAKLMPFAAAAAAHETQTPRVSPTKSSFNQTLDAQIGDKKSPLHVNHETVSTPCFHQSCHYSST